jgi:hypothetical protein
MIDFGMLVDGRPAPAPTATPVQEAPAQIAQQVTATKLGTAEAAYLLKPRNQWTWQDLRDYVITEQERRFGVQPRDPRKERGIFTGFISRHGVENAVLVAQAAFEVYEGMWASAPVTVTRFCKNSDPFFADVIITRLQG